MKLRSLLGGKLVALRDYLQAEQVVSPKGLRGGVPQTDGWPPTVDAQFYVLPRWMRWWIVLAPLVVIGLVGHAWRSLDATMREEGDHVRRVLFHKEKLDAEHGRK